MKPTAELSAELARLRGLHEAARLSLEIRQLQAAAGEPLVEDFGDVVDRREYLSDDPTFGFPLLNPFSVLSDRQEGKLWPIYQSEQDLARIRGRAHNITVFPQTGMVQAFEIDQTDNFPNDPTNNYMSVANPPPAGGPDGLADNIFSFAQQGKSAGR